MAKMFYKLEEAAEKLGMTEEQVKELANSGQLQRFLDRDQMMFKVKDVDALASNEDTGGLNDSAADTVMEAGDSDGPIPLADSGDTDAIQLSDDEPEASSPKADTRQATGVSVFDADEVELADPMAQTQVTGNISDDEDLALESVGSGSGLLDLTRESDDTSLGAELLDEIYPGSGEGSDAKMGDTAGSTATGEVGSSGVFDNAMAMQSGSSGLENITDGAVAPAPVMMSAPADDDVDDPVGSGWTGGMLLGVLAVLVVGMIIAISAILGAPNQLTTTIGAQLPIYAGAMLAACVVFGVVGLVLGKATSR